MLILNSMPATSFKELLIGKSLHSVFIYILHCVPTNGLHLQVGGGFWQAKSNQHGQKESSMFTHKHTRIDHTEVNAVLVWLTIGICIKIICIWYEN